MSVFRGPTIHPKDWRRLVAAALLTTGAVLLLQRAAQGQDITSGPSTPVSTSVVPETTEVEAPTFLGFYLWEQALFQYVDDGQGGYQVERGDQFGGRLVGGVGFGRFGAELRVDVSGLKEQFNAEDPATYTTLEVYGAAHYVALEQGGLQLGPMVAGGSVSNEQSVGGITFDFWGAGVRLAGHGAEFHLAIGRHDYLPVGGWRLSLSAHIPIKDQLYAVGDIVSGADGFVRAGIAVRVK